MTTPWEQTRDHVGKKSADVVKIIGDLVVFFVIAGVVILEDLGTEWLFSHLIKSGHLFTKGIIIIVGILLDLSALTVVCGWLKDDIRRLFK